MNKDFINYILRIKKMPIDLKKITIVTLDGKVVSGFTSHFATCPKSYEFRRKK